MRQTVTETTFNRSLPQRIAVIIVILAAILFSQFANAQKKEHKVKHNKTRYYSSMVSNSNKACYILYKKRMAMPKHSLLASFRRTKYKPMAETEQPIRLVSSN